MIVHTGWTTENDGRIEYLHIKILIVRLLALSCWQMDGCRVSAILD